MTFRALVRAGLALALILFAALAAHAIAPALTAVAVPANAAAAPHAAGVSSATPKLLAPADTVIPAGALGASVRRGRAILWATRDSLPHNVGSALRCVSCHLDGGTRASSGPWVGVYASFPQYNARAGRVFFIEDRINECLRRSMNGTPLADASPEMRDLKAYFAFLSGGIAQGDKPAWLGLRKLAPHKPDRAAGERLFAGNCARCHGAGGDGTALAPPLWGGRSFAIGAGMARLNTAAAFIRWNMPNDRPALLSDQQAYDVAAFVLSHPRPDTPGKERDWPNGDAPDDCPYQVSLLSRKH